MTPAESAALLTICAGFDNRKPDADQAKAWSLVLEGLRFEDCRDAIVAHYKASRTWIMPADVIDTVKRTRSKRIAEHPPVIPPEFHSIDEQQRWQREITSRIGDGETFDPDQFRPGELKARDIRELGAVKSPEADRIKALREEAAKGRKAAQAVKADERASDRAADIEDRKAKRAAAEAELAGLRDRLAKGDEPRDMALMAPRNDAEEATEVLTDECGSCGESPEGECPKSKRPCGHHCNHVWTHDACDWCGIEFAGEATE